MNTRAKLLYAASLLMIAGTGQNGFCQNGAHAGVTASDPVAMAPSVAGITGDFISVIESPAQVNLETITAGKFDKGLPVVVIVDKQKHQTHVLQLQGTALTDVLCVRNSTGKASTPTPEGHCVITQKQYDPIWKPPVSIDPRQRVVQPYSTTHKNPLGVANLRLSLERGLIALHGTNEPKQIGKNVSHGCIRHMNADILKVAALVKVGTPVYIVPELDQAKVSLSEFRPVQAPEHVAGDPSGNLTKTAAQI